MFADQLMAAAPPAAWAVWNELRIELNVGQLLDIVGSVRRDRTVAKAERICRYKSGKYTIERPLHLGAVLADPAHGAELFGALSAYGLPLGDAFQMRDDVMGAFGDRSAPASRSAATSSRASRRRCWPGRSPRRRRRSAPCSTWSATRARRRRRRRIQEVIVDTGALAALEAQIESLTAEACRGDRACPDRRRRPRRAARPRHLRHPARDVAPSECQQADGVADARRGRGMHSIAHVTLRSRGWHSMSYAGAQRRRGRVGPGDSRGRGQATGGWTSRASASRVSRASSCDGGNTAVTVTRVAPSAV